MQTEMNVLKGLIAVMMMQLATTLKEITPALATMDIQAMGFLALVSIGNQNITVIYIYISSILSAHTLQILMSASVAMVVAITTAITQLEVIHVPVIVATNSTVMDILVWVGEVINSD